MKSRTLLRHTVSLISVLLIAAGTLLAVRGLRDYGRYQSRKWPTTQGTVTFSETRLEIDFRLGSEFEIGSRQPDRNTYYTRPAITYRYRVGGTRYSNTTVSFIPIRDKVRSLRLVSDFPLNSTCKVYYHPRSPAKAVLLPGLPGTSMLTITAGIALGLSMLLLGIALIWARRPVRKAAGENSTPTS